MCHNFPLVSTVESEKCIKSVSQKWQKKCQKWVFLRFLVLSDKLCKYKNNGFLIVYFIFPYSVSLLRINNFFSVPPIGESCNFDALNTYSIILNQECYRPDKKVKVDLRILN